MILNIIRSLFKCKHDYELIEKSNAIQQDSMGYPLQLMLFRCSKCGKSKQMWIDVSENELNKLKTGEMVLVEWNKVN